MSTAMTVVNDEDGMVPGFQQNPGTISSAIQLAAAMVDKRISTARAYRRQISKFKQEASELLKEDIETARSAEYAKPVGGSVVKGPSIRLAELAAMCWGNLDVEVGEPIVGDKSVTVKATAWDLEKNYRQEAVVTTSILKRDGGRFPQHMVETASLSTASKAKRNAILAVIPRTYINDLLVVARAVASKNEKTLEERRRDTLDYFARSYKVQPEAIFAALSIGGIDDMTEDVIGTLRGMATAIKDGDAKVEEFFPVKVESKTDAIKERLAGRKKVTGEKTPEKPAIEQPTAVDGKLFESGSQQLPD